MLDSAEIKNIFTRSQAFIFDSHIIYTSGKHGKAYVNKDALYPHTEPTSLLCEQIEVHFQQAKV